MPCQNNPEMSPLYQEDNQMNCYGFQRDERLLERGIMFSSPLE